jgi:hypothetical protein
MLIETIALKKNNLPITEFLIAKFLLLAHRPSLFVIPYYYAII